MMLHNDVLHKIIQVSQGLTVSLMECMSNRHVDPLGRPTVAASSDHCFNTCCPSVPTF